MHADESGDHQYPTVDWKYPAHRYLALTGVIIEEQYYYEVILSKIRKIKLLIASDPNNLPILHRREILAQTGDYLKLRQPDVREQFDKQVLELLSDSGLVICTVVLDKTSHWRRYGELAYHPYHYASTVLFGKYTHFLNQHDARGDVMAEARGNQEDKALGIEYEKFYQNGTKFITADCIQQVLTSKLKIRRKSEAIAGLEIADLLTLATKIDVLHTFGHIKSLDSNFQTRIIERIQGNYYQENGTSKGFGKKFL